MAADMASKTIDASDLLRTLASPHDLMIVWRFIEEDQSVRGLPAHFCAVPVEKARGN